MKHSFFTYNAFREKLTWKQLQGNPLFLQYLANFNRENTTPAPVISPRTKVIGIGFYLRRKLGITSQITPKEAFLIFLLAFLAVMVAYCAGLNNNLLWPL